MKVLGIDPGTAACGYGLVNREGGRLRAVEHGWWSTPSGDAIEGRLKHLHDAVADLIDAHAPQAVVLEESYVGRDARTALSVGQVRGAILVACATADVPCAEYPPATVKKAVCGYGRAEKQQVARMVEAILALERRPASTHAADALAVAICHALAPPLLRTALA